MFSIKYNVQPSRATFLILLCLYQATLFGRDLGSIPCFRSSFLNGIGGGIGTGLTYFLFTSKVRQACHTTVLSFAGITLSYWYK